MHIISQITNLKVIGEVLGLGECYQRGVTVVFLSQISIILSNHPYGWIRAYRAPTVVAVSRIYGGGFPIPS
jgi:hypothetical protein